MRIPLPKMLRHWREREFAARLSPPTARRMLALWAWLATRPALYHLGSRLAMGVLGRLGSLGRNRGRFGRLPLAAGWTVSRDLPAPEGPTFQALWRASRSRGGGERP